MAVIDVDVTPTPPMVTLSDGSSLVFFHAPNSFEGLPAGINNFDATPDNSGDVYAQKFTASGTAVAAPFVLNETVFHTQYHPDVLVFGDGSFVVAWSQSQSGNSFAVGYQRFTADGTLDGGEVLLQTSDDPADTKVLEATTGNAFTILIGRTDQTFTVEDTANGNQTDTTPPVVTLSDGSSLVFFHAPNSFEGLPAGINNFDATPDNSGDVYAQKFTASGTAVAAPFVLNETVFHTQYHPDVLVFGDGSFVVAWSQSQSGNSFAVGYQRFTADGTLDGGEVLLQTSDDPADTKVLEATTGNAFTILIGRTDQTFTVEDTSNGNPTGSITISGTASEGQVLTVDTSSLADEDGLGALSYQWFANDEALVNSSPVKLYQRFNDQGDIREELLSYKLIGSAHNEDGNGHYAFELTFYKQLDNNIVEKLDVPSQITPPYSNYFVSAGSFYEVAPNTSTLTLTQSEVGKIITTKVSYTDDGGTSESVMSAATSAVTSVNDNPTGTVSITGTATEGQVLTVDTSNLADEDGLAAFSYQWLRGDADITGATSETYTLAQADVGAAISARVSYTDNGGTAESVTSSATGSIINVNDARVAALRFLVRRVKVRYLRLILPVLQTKTALAR